MVRFASSFIGAAIALSSLASAAPAKRQDITPILPAGGGASAPPEGGLSTVDPGAIPTPGEENPSLGNSVQIETGTAATDATTSTDVETTTATVDTAATESSATAPPYYSNSVETDSANVHTTIVNQPMYGSGSVNWHESYNECVQTCFASYPPPPTVVTLPPNSEGSHHGSDCGESGCPPSESGGSESGSIEPSASQANGGGATHEVMIEPSRGVQRYVPAFVNAAVGETVRFTVVNGEHSVVQSGALSPCNASVPGIDSGVLQTGGTFTITVNSTDPLFFFSSVGTDCASGLFGVINPPKGADDSNTTVAALMPQWADADPDIAAALNSTTKFAAQTGGADWGGKFDTASIPTEYHAQLGKSILYTRAVIGANPEMVDKNGVFEPTNEVVIPNDFSVLLATADQGGYPPAPVEQSAGPTEAAAQSAPTATPTGGAGSLVSSRVAVGGIALLAALLMF